MYSSCSSLITHSIYAHSIQFFLSCQEFFIFLFSPIIQAFSCNDQNVTLFYFFLKYKYLLDTFLYFDIMRNSYWKINLLIGLIERMFIMAHLTYKSIEQQYFYFFGWSYFFSFDFFGWKKVNIWFFNGRIGGNVKLANI